MKYNILELPYHNSREDNHRSSWERSFTEAYGTYWCMRYKAEAQMYAAAYAVAVLKHNCNGNI